MPEGIQQLHLLLAVAPGRMVGRKILDQLADPGAQLVGEMGRRGPDEGVDVTDRRLSHGGLKRNACGPQ